VDQVLGVEMASTFDVRTDRSLIVEGDFDIGFLRALLAANNRKGVDVTGVRGTGNFAASALARLAADDQNILRWIGLACDADQDVRGKFQGLQHIMQRFDEVCRQRKVPTFGIAPQAWQHVEGEEGRSSSLFVFPDVGEPGDIEKWTWQGIGTGGRAECVDAFVECLREMGNELEREWKTRVFALLASLARPDMPLSAAARAAQIPVDSPWFDRFLSLVPEDPAISDS